MTGGDESNDDVQENGEAGSSSVNDPENAEA